MGKLNLLEKWFFGIGMAFFIISAVLGGIVVNKISTLETQGSINYQKWLELNRQASKVLSDIMVLTSADSGQIMIFHDGIEQKEGLRFLFVSAIYEVTNDGVKSTLLSKQQIPLDIVPKIGNIIEGNCVAFRINQYREFAEVIRVDGGTDREMLSVCPIYDLRNQAIIGVYTLGFNRLISDPSELDKIIRTQDLYKKEITASLIP